MLRWPRFNQTYQFFTMSNRSLIFWHFSCLSLDNFPLTWLLEHINSKAWRSPGWNKKVTLDQTCRNNRIFRAASSSPPGVAGLYFRPRPFLLALLTIKVIKSVLFFRTFSCFLESPPRSRVLRASLRFLTISAGDRGRLKRGIFFKNSSNLGDVAEFWAERRLNTVPVRLRRQNRRPSWVCF